MEQKKLSQLQKNILMLIYNGGNCQVWKDEIRRHYKRSAGFDTEASKHRRRNRILTDSQRAATSRAIKRLIQRGLLHSDIEWIELTDDGLSVVQEMQPEAKRKLHQVAPNELADLEANISRLLAV